MNPVRLLRFRAGLSQQKAAVGAGITRQTLSAVEGGDEPSAKVARALAEYYGVGVEHILGIEPLPPVTETSVKAPAA
jgi:DNA-binding XRE family transcriptional regulator